MGLIDELIEMVIGPIFEMIDGVHDIGNGGVVNKKNHNNIYIPPLIQQTTGIVLQETNNAINKMADIVTDELIPNIVDKVLPAIIEDTKEEKEELTEYESIIGDGSEYPMERLELDSNYPIIRLSDSDNEDNNIFGSSLFRFRTQGPRFGSDVRLEPYFRIPMKFYENKWGEEIITFTDVLAGYIKLIEKIRIASRNPHLMFGVNMYSDPDAFMLGSLDPSGKMDSNIFITVKDGEYEVVWRRDLGWKIISGQTDY